MSVKWQLFISWDTFMKFSKMLAKEYKYSLTILLLQVSPWPIIMKYLTSLIAQIFPVQIVVAVNYSAKRCLVVRSGCFCRSAVCSGSVLSVCLFALFICSSVCFSFHLDISTLFIIVVCRSFGSWLLFSFVVQS